MSRLPRNTLVFLYKQINSEYQFGQHFERWKQPHSLWEAWCDKAITGASFLCEKHSTQLIFLNITLQDELFTPLVMAKTILSSMTQ